MLSLRAPASRQALLPLVFLGCALSAQSPFAKHPPALAADRLSGAEAVDVEQCKQWLYTLASPEYEGRQTGQPGFLKAAEYVSAHFRALGLEARGENGSYYQHVPWSATTIDAERTFIAIEKDGTEVLRIPSDRLTGNATASLSAAGEVVLLVIDPPPRPEGGGNRRRFNVPKIEGLAELELEGKVVVAFVKQGDGGMGDALTRFGLRQGLSGKNVAALLFAQAADATGGLTGRSGSRRTANPAAAGRRRNPGDTTFGGADITALLAAAAVDADVLAGEQLRPKIAPLSARVEINTTEGNAPAMNVWAVLPGSDPALEDEYVVIGSHLDHVGMRGGLHPGADDDASGTTGVMALARMFAANDVRPKRSILFVCFAGEEDGLVGSGFFARNPPIPLSAIVAELQMDMIGRDEEASRESRGEDRNEKAEDNRETLHLVGTEKLAPTLHTLCLAKNETAGFTLEYDQEGMFGRSDHANFARMGVPVAFFFTGLHRDYHETTDTPDKIHFEKLLRVATYVYDIAFELAQQPGRPEIDPDLWGKMGRKGSEQPAAPLMKGGGE